MQNLVDVCAATVDEVNIFKYGFCSAHGQSVVKTLIYVIAVAYVEHMTGIAAVLVIVGLAELCQRDGGPVLVVGR